MLSQQKQSGNKNLQYGYLKSNQSKNNNLLKNQYFDENTQHILQSKAKQNNQQKKKPLQESQQFQNQLHIQNENCDNLQLLKENNKSQKQINLQNKENEDQQQFQQQQLDQNKKSNHTYYYNQLQQGILQPQNELKEQNQQLRNNSILEHYDSKLKENKAILNGIWLQNRNASNSQINKLNNNNNFGDVGNKGCLVDISQSIQNNTIINNGTKMENMVQNQGFLKINNNKNNDKENLTKQIKYNSVNASEIKIDKGINFTSLKKENKNQLSNQIEVKDFSQCQSQFNDEKIKEFIQKNGKNNTNIENLQQQQDKGQGYQKIQFNPKKQIQRKSFQLNQTGVYYYQQQYQQQQQKQKSVVFINYGSANFQGRNRSYTTAKKEENRNQNEQDIKNQNSVQINIKNNIKIQNQSQNKQNNRRNSLYQYSNQKDQADFSQNQQRKIQVIETTVQKNKEDQNQEQLFQSQQKNGSSNINNSRNQYYSNLFQKSYYMQQSDASNQNQDFRNLSQYNNKNQKLKNQKSVSNFEVLNTVQENNNKCDQNLNLVTESSMDENFNIDIQNHEKQNFNQKKEDKVQNQDTEENKSETQKIQNISQKKEQKDQNQVNEQELNESKKQKLNKQQSLQNKSQENSLNKKKRGKKVGVLIKKQKQIFTIRFEFGFALTYIRHD
ncbi:hypothetical protein PPERSA_01444 [Pseudocohnilembus persalinus]|uniref:Uncharacterized protein n=1 Tax=Pseudocohnilembus persalinus TaxID=266149 RepID=A0A0V0QHJ9_PSEPJ|nr:hypothetical protein PPERSA_01444 [Pseudocohnilembus persalinus]|eukprot:KRX01541.1 hypothetical protein PPERSA_01444 [Pseudocohnilembus persalinus]